MDEEVGTHKKKSSTPKKTFFFSRAECFVYIIGYNFINTER